MGVHKEVFGSSIFWGHHRNVTSVVLLALNPQTVNPKPRL